MRGKGDIMKNNEKTVDFDLSLLSLQELITVYQKVAEFLDFLESKKIVEEEKSKENYK